MYQNTATRLTTILTYILLIFLLLHSKLAKADIIRDSEIEEAINLVAKPVVLASGLKDIKIYLINDNSLNAFTSGGNEIYIFSGLINQFPDPEVLRGVIAHEIGHILGKHVIRQLDNISNYSKIALSSAAIGLATAASGTGDVSLAAALALAGVHFSERSILQHSRTFEFSADQAALKLLEKSGNSCDGMIKFFEYMNAQHRGSYINPYDQTHPMSEERLATIREFYQKSKYKSNYTTKEVQYKFARSAAKLYAFTQDPKKVLKSISLYTSNSELAYYLKAIAYFRNSNLDQALLEVDHLIKQHPNDAFYHELKGQILFEFGKKEALTSYQKAAELRPNDRLIKLSKAIVALAIHSSSKEQIAKINSEIKSILDREPDNLLAIFYLSITYEKLGNTPLSLLTSANLALKTGDLTRAKGLAKEAIKRLSTNSPEWYKANDIITLEQ